MAGGVNELCIGHQCVWKGWLGVALFFGGMRVNDQASVGCRVRVAQLARLVVVRVARSADGARGAGEEARGRSFEQDDCAARDQEGRDINK